MKQRKERESGIELLKILAMILIVISHVTRTLLIENPYFVNDYLVPFDYASTDLQKQILAWFSSFGFQGNDIFFICSAWFLLDSKKIDTKKIVHIISDVWIINVLILIFFKLGGWFKIPTKEVIKCFFPNILALNWYTTCYILIYLIHPALNQFIKSRTQKQLLTVNIVTLTLYCGINYLVTGQFFSSALIIFVVIYIAVGYIKIYMPNYCKNRKVNYITLMIGMLGTLLLMLFTNFLGMHISFFQNKITRWGLNFSPFILLVAISLLNLFKGKIFVNNTINYLSKLTLLVYIIHDNILVSRYLRPQLWICIHEKLGYDFLVVWDLLLSISVFIVSVILAYLYKVILQRIIYKVSDKLHDAIMNLYEKLVSGLMEILN